MATPRNRFLVFVEQFWPSMLVLGVILYATLASHPIGADEMPPIPHLDKFIHAVMMGGLVGAIAFDLARRQPKDKRAQALNSRSMWLIFWGVVAFSAADEWAQPIISECRGKDVLDFAADCLGAFVAVYLAPPAIRKVLKIEY